MGDFAEELREEQRRRNQAASESFPRLATSPYPSPKPPEPEPVYPRSNFMYPGESHADYATRNQMERFGTDEDAEHVAFRKWEQEAQAAPFQAMAAGLSLGPGARVAAAIPRILGGAAGAGAEFVKDVGAATVAGGPMAGARVAGPAITTVGLPIAEGLALRDAAGPKGGLMGEAEAAVAGPVAQKVASFADEMAEVVGAGGSRASQRGAVLNPAVAVEGAYKWLKERSTAHPGLDKITMPDSPDNTADYALTLSQAKGRATGERGTIMARGIRGATPDEKAMEAEFLKALDFRNQAQIASEQIMRGEPVRITGGITGAEAMQEAADAEARVKAMPGGVAYWNEAMTKTDALRHEMAQYSVKTKQMDPKSIKPDYVPGITEGKFTDENLPGLVPDSEAAGFVKSAVAAQRRVAGGQGPLSGPMQGAPGHGQHAPVPSAAGSIMMRREKHRSGSTAPQIGDPLDRLAIKYAETRRKGEMNDFAERLKPLALTQDVLNGLPFDKSEHVVYYYGNGEFEVFPRGVGVAISKALRRGGDERPIMELLEKANRFAASGILKHNISFQSKQRLDDPTWAALNAPWGHKIKTFRKAREYMKIAERELKLENEGIPSQILTKWREEGQITNVYESLIQRVNDVKTLTDKTKRGGGMGYLDRLGESREAGTKRALYETWLEVLGGGTGPKGKANMETAARISNQRTGNFVERSALGRDFGAVTFATKWYANALSILTKPFTDPVTGKGLRRLFSDPKAVMRGFSSNPMSVIPAAYVAAKVWNGAWTKGKNTDGDGLIVPGTDYKIMFPGIGGLVKSLENLVRHPLAEMGKRASPPLQLGADVFGINYGGLKGPYREAERFVAPMGQFRRMVDPKAGEKSKFMEFLKIISPVTLENWKRDDEFQRKRDRGGHTGVREE